jgi:hypothetical protein
VRKGRKTSLTLSLMRPSVTGSIAVLLPFYFDLEVGVIIKGEKGNRYLSTGQSDIGRREYIPSLFINYYSHTYSQRASSRETHCHSQPNTHCITGLLWVRSSHTQRRTLSTSNCSGNKYVLQYFWYLAQYSECQQIPSKLIECHFFLFLTI